MPKPSRPAKGLRLRAQLRIMLDTEIAMGPGKADLLEAIRDTGSISGAGKQMGMSYRRAWLLVDSMNRCFKTSLVDTATGGNQGGGARLTEQGETVLAHYRELERAVAGITEHHVQYFAPLLRKTPMPPSH
jgi:molybdate transport system regulatory protein